MPDSIRDAGRRDTPIHIDPEETPPPQEIPVLRSLPGHESIPPPIQERFEAIDAALAGIHGAVAHAWPARSDPVRMGHLEAKIEAYTQGMARHDEAINKFIVPFVTDAMAVLSELKTSRAEASAEMRHMTTAIQEMGIRLKQEVESHDERLTVVEDQVSGHTVQIQLLQDARPAPRLTALERFNDDRALATTASTKERVRIFTWAKAGLAAAVAIVTAVVVKLGAIVEWIRKP